MKRNYFLAVIVSILFAGLGEAYASANAYKAWEEMKTELAKSGVQWTVCNSSKVVYTGTPEEAVQQALGLGAKAMPTKFPGVVIAHPVATSIGGMSTALFEQASTPSGEARVVMLEKCNARFSEIDDEE